MNAILKFGQGDVSYVYPQHLKSKCEEMIGARQGEVSGVVMEGWGARWLRGVVPFWAAPPHTHPTPSPIQFPCPSPTSAPAVEGQPMTHCIMDFGVLGRPSSTCLTLTPTTATAVICLVWGRLDGRLTSWQLNIGIIHMLKTHVRISQWSLIFSGSALR